MTCAAHRPTVAALRAMVDYDPESGLFTWRHRVDVPTHVNARLAGKAAGAVSSDGYVCIKINDRSHKAHRIAWAIVSGAWPAGQIDHINRTRTDNRIANLRPATHAQNSVNKAASACSGAKGVYRCRTRWQAKIQRGGTVRHLGMFGTVEEASKAFQSAHLEAWGEFADRKGRA